MNPTFLPLQKNMNLNISSPRSAALFAAIIALFFVVAMSNNANAQSTYFWRTEAANGNWQQSGNTQWWQAGSSATGFNFGVQWWDNNHFLTQTNNTASAATHAFHFASGANSAHTFVGSSVRLYDSGGNNPYIRNLSSATHIFNFAIELDGDSADPLELRMDSTGGLTFNGNITNNGSTINVIGTDTSAKTNTFNGIISGTGGFYMSNSGVVSLFSAANTMTGQLTLDAGTARLTNSGTFGGSSQEIRIASGATLSLNGVNATVGSVGERGSGNGGTISLGSGTLTVTANNLETFQSTISGTGGLTKQGSHTLNLYGSQSYTGTTTVQAGRLSSSGTLASGSYSITGGTLALSGNNRISTNNTVTITLGGGTLRLDSGEQTLNGAMTLTSATTSVISVGTGAGPMNVVGAIGGSGALTKEGGAQLNLSGDNTYTGATTVSAGSLEAQSANALGTTANGTTVSADAALRLWNATGVTFAGEGLSLVGTGVGSTGALLNAGGANIWQGNITLAGGARIGAVTDSSLTLSGNVDLASTANTLYLGGAGNITIGSNLLNAGKNTGDGAIYWDGSGALRFNQATQSALTGNINLRSGTVLLGAADALGSGAVTASAGSTLTLASADTTARSINNNVTLAGNLTLGQAATGTGAVTLGGTLSLGATRTITVNNNLSTISGAISGATFGLSKAGTGTLVLSSASSSYSGATTVSAGTLEFNGSNTSTTTTIASGGTLAGSGTLAGVTVQNGGRIGAGASGGIGNLTVSALTLDAVGGYNWELGNVTGTPGTNWDLLTVGGGTGTVTVNSTSVNPFTIFVTGNPTGWNPANNGSWTIMNAGTLSGFAANKFNVNTSGFGGSLTTGTWAFSDSSGDLVLSYNAPITDITVIVNTGAVDQGAGAGITGGAAQFTGTGSLVKSGAGTLIMTNGANNYTGGTTIAEGAISINVAAPSGSAGALGNSSDPVNVGTSGANVATGFDFGAAVENQRALNIVAGNGTSGTRAITTSFGSGTATQSGAVTIGTNTTINAASGSTLLISGNLTGGASAALNITGSGATVLSGNSTLYSGPITNASTSTLRVGHNSGLGTGALTLNGGTFAAADGSARTLANNITLGGNVTLGDATGTGDLTLNGTVGLGSSTRTLTVGNLTTLGGAVGGSGGLTKSGSGTLILAGVNTFSGNVDITAGRLNVANSSAIGNSAAVTISNNGTLGVSSLEEIGSLAGEGAVSLGALLIAGGNNSSTTYSGEMRNGGGFVKKGTGTLTLAGASIATGETYIVGGTLLFTTNQGGSFTNIINIGETDATGTNSIFAIGGNGLTFANNVNVRAGDADTATIDAQNTTGTSTLNGSLTLGKNADIRAAAGGGLLINGNISGNFTIGKRGAGTATLAGTTAGGTKFDLWEGELQIGSASNLGDSATFVNNKIYFDGGTLGATGTFTIGGNNGMFVGSGGANFRVAAANTLTVAGPIDNAATNSITKLGAGTLVLTSTSNSGNNRYDLLDGELQESATGNLGDKTGSFLANKLFFNGGTLGVTGNMTLDGENGITLGGNGTIRVASGNTLTLQGYINDQALTGLTLSKTGAGTLFFDKVGENDFSGTTIVINEGAVSTWNPTLLSPAVALGSSTAATSGTYIFTKTDGAVTATNNFAVNSGGGAIRVTDNTLTVSGALSGSGAFSKTGAGTLTLSGNSSYAGALTVSAGTLQLNRTGGAALGSVDSINVATGAVLLLSQSSQVNSSTAEVTLSGGTITRGGNVSEVFGNLNLTAGSFLDYGAANDIGTLRFGTYTPSALLTVNNFLPGSKLQFGNTISSTDLNNATLFSFSSGFTTSTEDGFFTITAIPEPSTYLAAAGLLALFLWPARRRLIKDTKSIFGLRPTGRDRIEAYRNA